MSQDGSGWVVGFPPEKIGDSALRLMPKESLSRGPLIKWKRHVPGDPDRKNKPVSSGQTLSALVGDTGHFCIRLSRTPDFPSESTTTIDLKRCGDYALWGPGWFHEWDVLEPSRIMTVRWELESGA